MSDDLMLACHDITKVYTDTATRLEILSGVDLEVKSGERVAIIGASGSGKSTLLQILGGVDEATAGQVTIAGSNLLAMNEKQKSRFRNRHIGFIYQFHHLLPEFNALENVMMPLLIGGVSRRDAALRAHDIIVKVGLKARALHRVGELSGGERQRIAIARALVTKPSCVLADEPTGNLDQATSQQVFEVMMQLHNDLNTAFVMVTHNRELAAEHDRILSLENGKLAVEQEG